MKKYLYSLALAAATIGMTSCDGTQEEPKIQWYPVVTIEGESAYYLELGDSFTVPGFTAINTLTGEDASYAVDVLIYDVIAGDYVDAVDTSSPGMFNIYYISEASEVPVSSDYDIYKEVDVYVYDPTVETDISGYYNINMDDTYYLGAGALEGATFTEAAEYYGNVTSSTVSVSQLLPGFFYFSDLLAGWYDQLRGYGSYYAMTGYVSLNSDNTLTLLSSYIAGWGDGLTSFSDGYYDEETETITYTAMYVSGIGVEVSMTNADAE